MLKRLHPLFLSALLLALLSAACGSGPGSTTQSNASSHSAQATQAIPATQPVQPVTGQQILTNGPVTYVALGASDAVGVGSNQPGSQGYVPLLAQRLPKGSRPINLGISGIKLHRALQEEVPLALSTSPKLITIWLVTNDFVANVSYDSYMQDLDTLLKQLRAGTHARIIMANLPDLTRLPAFAKLTSAQKASMLTQITRWNEKIAKIAAIYAVGVVDLFAQDSKLTAHPEYISVDGFHPSPAGYVQLANYFWDAIKQ